MTKKVNSSDCHYSNWSIYNTCTENGDVKKYNDFTSHNNYSRNEPVSCPPLALICAVGSTGCPLKVDHETGQLSVPGVCFRTMICNSHEALPANENKQVLKFCLCKAAIVAFGNTV